VSIAGCTLIDRTSSSRCCANWSASLNLFPCTSPSKLLVPVLLLPAPTALPAPELAAAAEATRDAIRKRKRGKEKGKGQRQQWAGGGGAKGEGERRWERNRNWRSTATAAAVRGCPLSPTPDLRVSLWSAPSVLLCSLPCLRLRSVLLCPALLPPHRRELLVSLPLPLPLASPCFWRAPLVAPLRRRGGEGLLSRAPLSGATDTNSTSTSVK
jgi:hypothetical protein